MLKSKMYRAKCIGLKFNKDGTVDYVESHTHGLATSKEIAKQVAIELLNRDRVLILNLEITEAPDLKVPEGTDEELNTKIKEKSGDMGNIDMLDMSEDTKARLKSQMDNNPNIRN